MWIVSVRAFRKSHSISSMFHRAMLDARWSSPFLYTISYTFFPSLHFLTQTELAER